MTRAPLILVVGPSGAGKDSLMAGAQERLQDEPHIHFARRVVTRPMQAGGEAHESVSQEQFDRVAAAGGFLLSWTAHGLSYGIAAEVEDLRRDGRTVVANVSRGVIDGARRRLAPVGVIVVTAPAEVLAERLRARGREDAADIRHRLERAATALPEGEDVVTVNNDGSLKTGVDRFVDALHRLSACP